MNASDLYQRIAALHAAPEWACFPEVADATGGRARRRADAVAMSLWPSRGLIVRGFEIKISRSDWKREAADPTKAETITRYCDEWWVVTPDGLIKDYETELPPAWGLMVPANGTGLRVVRKAERTDAEPLTRVFLAAVLRAADAHVREALSGWLRREDIQDEIDAAEERGKNLTAGRELEYLERDLTRARRALDDFKAASGLDLLPDQWNNMGKEIGQWAKVGQAICGRYGSALPQVSRFLDGIINCTEAARKELAAILPAEVRP